LPALVRQGQGLPIRCTCSSARIQRGNGRLLRCRHCRIAAEGAPGHAQFAPVFHLLNGDLSAEMIIASAVAGVISMSN
jgi:hypothetical protein